MSFGWLGSFRQTQWREFRSFALKERKSANARLAVLDADIQRIGEITMFYARRSSLVDSRGELSVADAVTEVRTGFSVSPGSSLEKLLIAYIVLGGNPGDISLFLKPDRVEFQSEIDPSEDPNVDPSVQINDIAVPDVNNEQPHFGMIAPESDNRGIGGADRGGWLEWGRYPFARIGRIINLSDADGKIANQVDYARRWVNPAIQERRNNLESKIIKLMDLKEQLQDERDKILMQAIGGTITGLPIPDPREFHSNLHLVKIVESLDGIFYLKKRRAERTGSLSETDLVSQLLSIGTSESEDSPTEEELVAGILASRGQLSNPESEVVDFDTVNIQNLSKFDSLWKDEPDDDRFSAL